VARDTGIAAREHLRALFVIPGQKHVGGVFAIGGERVGAKTGATAGDGRQMRSHGFAAQIVGVHQMLFESDTVEMAGGWIAVDFGLVGVSGERLAVGFAHAEQFFFRLFRDGRAGELGAPWVANPDAFRMTELRAEVKAGGGAAHAIGSSLNVEAFGDARRSLILKLAPIDADGGIEFGEWIR